MLSGKERDVRWARVPLKGMWAATRRDARSVTREGVEVVDERVYVGGEMRKKVNGERVNRQAPKNSGCHSGDRSAPSKTSRTGFTRFQASAIRV